MSLEDGSPLGESFANEAFAVTADAYAHAADDWEVAIRAAIARLFDFLASRPASTRSCFLEDCEAEPAALARRDRMIERFTTLLQPGFATTATPPPPIVAEAIGGGIYELVRGCVIERRLDRLPDATPDATVLALSPFVGAEQAIALASPKNVQASH
jgi:hypothetical protein